MENASPSLNINRFKADSLYGTLDYHLLKTVCDSSTLDDYDYKLHKFVCDNFAVCMNPHDHTKSDNRGSLCGIMCGRNMYS